MTRRDLIAQWYGIFITLSDIKYFVRMDEKLIYSYKLDRQTIKGINQVLERTYYKGFGDGMEELECEI